MYFPGLPPYWYFICVQHWDNNHLQVKKSWQEQDFIEHTYCTVHAIKYMHYYTVLHCTLSCILWCQTKITQWSWCQWIFSWLILHICTNGLLFLRLHAGVLLCLHTGFLASVCWCFLVSMCWCSFASVCWCSSYPYAGIFLRLCVGVLLHLCAGVLLHLCAGVLLCLYSGVCLNLCLDVLLLQLCASVVYLQKIFF